MFYIVKNVIEFPCKMKESLSWSSWTSIFEQDIHFEKFREDFAIFYDSRRAVFKMSTQLSYEMEISYEW